MQSKFYIAWKKECNSLLDITWDNVGGEKKKEEEHQQES